MLASLVPLVFAGFGAVASAALGARTQEEIVKVAAVGTALLCTLLCLVFAPLVLKAVLVLIPSSLALLSSGGDG